MKNRNTLRYVVIVVTGIVLIGGMVNYFYGLHFSSASNSVFKRAPANTFVEIQPTTKITELEAGLSTVRYDEEYQFVQFLSQGGASSLPALVKYLEEQVLFKEVGIDVKQDSFGCSTLSVKGENGYLFGRNFDWKACQAMIVMSHAPNVYASISTVNMNFISSDNSIDISQLSSRIKTMIALYAPVDGMNEKGLCVSVNMIQDTATIAQDTGKPDLTTSTAVRLLLNQAANVEEAISLLEQYDLHASFDMMVHFAISDASGKSVVIEYIDNQMKVIETPVVTNFYIGEGKKQGIGTSQSHERYQILMESIQKTPVQTMEDVKNALDSVSKDNFNEFEATQWSMVCNQSTGEIQYYHQENYQQGYVFQLNQQEGK